MTTNPSRYTTSADQSKYRDESPIDSKWIPSVEVVARRVALDVISSLLTEYSMSTDDLKPAGSRISYGSMDILADDIRSRPPVLQPISLLKLVFDGISLLIVLLTWLLFKYLLKPVRRAFLCSDLNLYHPPPQKKVIPTWLLFVCAIIIPLIFIFLSEGVRWYYLLRKKAARVVYKIQFRSKVYNVPEWAGNLYIIVGVFLFANCANSFLTNVGKVAVGRLRPHFIPSCFEKYSYRDFCTDPNQWIVNYTCLGETSSALKDKDGAYDIRQSFPSGHASSAFCGLIFLALYIHRVWNYRNIGLFPYVMQMLCFALAAYIGITRITDNRHHATDVLSGAILGTVVAIIGFRYMVGSFKRSVMLDLGSGSTTE